MLRRRHIRQGSKTKCAVILKKNGCAASMKEKNMETLFIFAKFPEHKLLSLIVSLLLQSAGNLCVCIFAAKIKINWYLHV